MNQSNRVWVMPGEEPVEEEVLQVVSKAAPRSKKMRMVRSQRKQKF